MKWALCWVSTVACAGAIAACSAAPTSEATNDGAGEPPPESGGSTAARPDSGAASADSGGATRGDDDAGSRPAADAGASQDAGSPPSPDASPSPQPDAAPPSSGDGTPTRQPCTGNFGSALTTTHGRIDGYLVSIVNVGGSSQCNGDSSHVHLQIKMNGAIYDVAVNTDTLIAERDIPVPDGAWQEGWHTSDGLDYAQLGLHSSDFKQPASPSALAQQIESELANVNHISVFATGYGPTGAHLVHRNGGGKDGAIVTEPLSGQAHVMMFTFTSSSPF